MNPFFYIRALYDNAFRWLTVPQSGSEMDRRNFLNVQIDAVGVGLASAANPFLPVFLTRLGATTLQVGLLTTMPAVTGLLLSIPLGQFLQSRRNIVPWFSMARLTVLSGYALTGIITFFLPEEASTIGILGIWALATIPQTILNITFSVVMNSVAGPAGRYELMTHRWSILGFTNAMTALVAGQVLDGIKVFPLNYQIVFIALSIGGLVSYYFSSQINLPDNPQVETDHKPHSLRERAGDYVRLIASEKPFVSFVAKRFVFLTGAALAMPLFPIYFVRELHAPDSWIALINTISNVIVIIGYFFWMRQTRRHGSLMVLVATTFGGSLYPILTGMTHSMWLIPVFAALNGIFQAGLNLVFFDELMKRVPVAYSATFVAAAQGLQYMSSIVAPLIATWLADTYGFSAALILSGLVSLLGFGMFMTELIKKPEPQSQEAPAK